MKNVLMILVTASIVAGCAHGHSRGTVVFKDNDKEGHVCIGHSEVKPGEVVRVFKNVCKSKEANGGERGPRRSSVCEKQFVGEGKITEFSGEHFAKIEALGSLNLEQGLIVEKAVN